MADGTPKRKQLKVEVAAELDRAVENLAHQRDVSKRQVVEEALLAYFENVERSAAA